MKVFKGIDDGGFTLVELLIVIALIAILSVAVLATINPIEQTNKARDAATQNDAAEVLNAYERMYANSQEYPWMKFVGSLAVGDTVVLSSKTVGFGICYGVPTDAYTATGACNTSSTTSQYGQLILADELKSSFAGKTAFTSAKAPDAMEVVKQANGSIYVCYVPAAKSNQLMVSKLKCVDATSKKLIDNGVGTCVAPVAGASAFTTAAADATGAIWRCVPESAVTVVPTPTP